MRRTLLALCGACALCLLSPSLAGAQENMKTEAGGAWQELYARRLESSAAYREARLSLKSAQIALDQYAKPYLPLFSLSSGSGGALSYTDKGFGGLGLSSTLGMENLLGGNLSLKTGFSLSPLGDFTLSDPSLTYSRKLFSESAASRLDAEAALLNARSSLRTIEINTVTSLAKEILDARYYGSLLENNTKNLQVLERVKTATVDPTSLRELERRILSSRKSLIAANNALENIPAEVRDFAEPLYQDLLALEAEWLGGIGEGKAAESLSVLALERSLEAAEKRSDNALLPYLPNPGLSASISYDIDKKALGWGISLSLSYDVLNKGKSALEAEKRREYPAIYEIKLAEAQKSLSKGLKDIQVAIGNLELDGQIQALDVDEARENAEKAQALYSGGFSSEENLVMARIDLSVEETAAEKIEYDILSQKIGLIRYYASAFEL